MIATSSLLVSAMVHPERMCELDLAGWDLLVRQARISQLLPRLATRVEESGLNGRIPAAPLRHLLAARELQQRQRQAVRWEVAHLTEALAARGVRALLLKGAAYEMAGLPPARCRLFSDIDILVPRAQLDAAEMALMMHGWVSSHLDAYDQRYYRRWMHELPPMRHLTRHSVIDIHHNLVPDTAPIHPDPGKLLAAARPCPDAPDVWVLSDLDLILHSAVHLFNDGEFDHALRDLLDIDELTRHLLPTPAHWLALVERARELDLSRPLFYAVRYLQRVLGRDIPTEVQIAADAAGPVGPLRPLMDAVFERGLQPDHASCSGSCTRAARFGLYLRGHFLRMPLHLLLPHLVRKAWMRNESVQKRE
ncbi:MAG: nucleotidyltransferase family protein [Rhodocyclaceae bacterium]